MPISRATEGERPPLIPSAVITPVRAIVDPTARSMPPLMMIRVIPIAPIATITVCERTMRRLFGERNRAGVSIKSEKIPITKRRPRTGPRRFSQFCSRPVLKKARLCFTSATMLNWPQIKSFQILIERGMQKRLYLRRRHILFCDQHHPRVDLLAHGPAEDTI